MTDIQVRRLKTGDIFAVASMIAKTGKAAFKQIEEGMTEQQVGVLVLTSAFEEAGSDLEKWLADLIGVTVKEFQDMPLDTPFIVLEKLQEQEDMISFLERARGLMRKFFGNKST